MELSPILSAGADVLKLVMGLLNFHAKTVLASPL